MNPKTAAASRHKAAWWLSLLALAAVSTNPRITAGHDFANRGLMALMALSPLVLCLRSCRVFIPRIDIPAIVYGILVVAFPLIFHPESIRVTTLLLTGACCCWAMAIARLARTGALDAKEFMRIIRWIIYAYAVVLIIQQACVLFGWPLFNPGRGYNTGPGANPWKLGALMCEPSYSSLIIASLLFYHGLTMRRIDRSAGITASFRRNPLMWAAAVWVWFSTFNASAFIWTPFSLLPLLSRRRLSGVAAGVAGLVALLAALPLGQEIPLEERGTMTRIFQRIGRMSYAIVTLDSDSIREADPSIAARVVPTIEGARRVSLTEADDWTGRGVDADWRDMPGVAGSDRMTAGMFHVWYNYGIAASLALWWLIITVTAVPRVPATWVMGALLIFLSSECNWQLFWCPMTLALFYLGTYPADSQAFRALASRKAQRALRAHS